MQETDEPIPQTRENIKPMSINVLGQSLFTFHLSFMNIVKPIHKLEEYEIPPCCYESHDSLFTSYLSSHTLQFSVLSSTQVSFFWIGRWVWRRWACRPSLFASSILPLFAGFCLFKTDFWTRDWNSFCQLLMLSPTQHEHEPMSQFYPKYVICNKLKSEGINLMLLIKCLVPRSGKIATQKPMTNVSTPQPIYSQELSIELPRLQSNLTHSQILQK